MAQEQKLLFLYCEENLHVGAGSSTGTIDLPIQREGHTDYPKIEGSSLRGAIREAFTELPKVDNSKLERVFGKWDSGDQQSAVDFPDAKILLFPVRSYKGVFAWITCPLVLKRFEKDYSNWFNVDLNIDIPEVKNQQILVQNDSKILVKNEVVLEEFRFKKENDDFPMIDTDDLGTWAQSQFKDSHDILKMMTSHVAVVSDEVFKDFVRLYTVKITRNRIDPKTGTADGGALFNEEFLPSESLMYSFVLASDEFKDEDYLTSDKVMEFLCDLPNLIRVGGDKGIGKGLIRTSLINKKSKL